MATLEQEGYRWRYDDGDEDAATWIENQDTNITRWRNVNTRLRVLVNATGDPDPAQFRLEYRKKGTTNWYVVDTGMLSNLPSPSPSASPSKSPSVSPSPSPSLSPSASVSPSLSPSASASPSLSPSASVSPSLSPSASRSPSESPSPSPSLSPSASRSPSPSPSLSPSASASPSMSPSPSAGSYLFRETFEGTNSCYATDPTATCDNHDFWTPQDSSWLFNGTGLQGTYAATNSNAGQKDLTVTGWTPTGNKVYVTTMWKCTSSGGGGYVLALRNGSTYLGGLQLIWDTDHWYYGFKWSHLAGQSSAGGTMPYPNQLWYFKIEYTKGTGANAVWNWYGVQDSGGFPGWGSPLRSEVNNADDDHDFDTLYIQHGAAVTDFWDDIRISTSNITY